MEAQCSAVSLGGCVRSRLPCRPRRASPIRGDPLTVAADPTQLQQALANVVQNAIQYNEAGGHVAVVLEWTGGAERWRIVIRDDGPGVPAELWPRLTERLFRGDEARARRPGGMGLGLAITAQVMEAHGWTLEFDQVEPQGLEVRILG